MDLIWVSGHQGIKATKRPMNLQYADRLWTKHWQRNNVVTFSIEKSVEICYNIELVSFRGIESN